MTTAHFGHAAHPGVPGPCPPSRGLDVDGPSYSAPTGRGGDAETYGRVYVASRNPAEFVRDRSLRLKFPLGAEGIVLAYESGVGHMRRERQAGAKAWLNPRRDREHREAGRGAHRQEQGERRSEVRTDATRRRRRCLPQSTCG